MNAIVTGGTRGIGKAIALKLAENGYSLFICARNEAELNEFTVSLKQKHPQLNFYGIPTDCSDPVSLQKFADFVQQHISAPDVLVNNAGMFIPESIFKENNDTLERQWQLNVNAAYLLSKVFGSKMRDQSSGYIFNICSVASIRPVKAAAAYTVTKFALLGLTRVLQQELKPSGVKVTAVIPGSVYTSSWDGSGLNPEDFTQPDDIASAIENCLKMSKNANVDEIIIEPLKQVN